MFSFFRPTLPIPNFELCRYCNKHDENLMKKIENHQEFHFHLDCWIKKLVDKRIDSEFFREKFKKIIYENAVTLDFLDKENLLNELIKGLDEDLNE